MNALKRIVPVLLSALMLMLMAAPVRAAETTSPKEEVVYIMTDSSGSVEGVYVVNIFGKGDITDYGSYSEVRTLNTNDIINQDDDKLSFIATADRTYYQGTLEDVQIPWDISIKYLMDGKEYSADKIAGMSGKLEITIDIKQNAVCNSIFFDNYALQAGVTLDTEKCSDIQAEGATVAEAGGDRKLSYIILPGNEKEFTVTANVNDFEMDPIEIVGLLLDIGDSIDIDANSFDLSEYEDDISDLKDGAVDLNDGAEKLYDGAKDLEDGASDLTAGAKELSSGLGKLNGKSDDILSGTEQITDTVFASATTQLRKQLVAAGMSEDEAAQFTLTPDNYIAVIAQLSGGTPTPSQIKQAENSIRDQLYAAGITDVSLQSVAMTLAADFLSDGYASTVSDALNQAGTLMADAAYVQTAVATYSTSTDPVISATLSALAAALTADPYNMDASTAMAVACTAIALNSSNPTGEIENAIAKVQNAGVVGSTTPDSDSIDALCIAAVQEQMAGAAEEFLELKTQLDGAASFLTGIRAYTAGVSDAASGAKSVLFGAAKLADGASDLVDGAGELADGTDELRNKTGDFFNGDISGDVQEKINDKIADFSADDFIPVSFVSDKNTNVKSVQFVIKIAAVEVSEDESTSEQSDKTVTFWQKLLRLFGIEA